MNINVMDFAVMVRDTILRAVTRSTITYFPGITDYVLFEPPTAESRSNIEIYTELEAFFNISDFRDYRSLVVDWTLPRHNFVKKVVRYNPNVCYTSIVLPQHQCRAKYGMFCVIELIPSDRISDMYFMIYGVCGEDIDYLRPNHTSCECATNNLNYSIGYMNTSLCVNSQLCIEKYTKPTFRRCKVCQDICCADICDLCLHTCIRCLHAPCVCSEMHIGPPITYDCCKYEHKIIREVTSYMNVVDTTRYIDDIHSSHICPLHYYKDFTCMYCGNPVNCGQDTGYKHLDSRVTHYDTSAHIVIVENVLITALKYNLNGIILHHRDDIYYDEEYDNHDGEKYDLQYDPSVDTPVSDTPVGKKVHYNTVSSMTRHISEKLNKIFTDEGREKIKVNMNGNSHFDIGDLLMRDDILPQYINTSVSEIHIHVSQLEYYLSQHYHIQRVLSGSDEGEIAELNKTLDIYRNKDPTAIMEFTAHTTCMIAHNPCVVISMC